MSSKNRIDNPLRDIQVLSRSQLVEKYGIEFIGFEDEPKTIWDPVEDKVFDTLQEWAEYYIEVNEDLDNFSKIGRHQDWDDDY